jgi:hypothetical protein
VCLGVLGRCGYRLPMAALQRRVVPGTEVQEIAELPR